jgi:hypothetical protein
MRHICKEIINMPPSLCEALLAYILIVIVQVFEVMFVQFNFGGYSTIGKFVTYTGIYSFYLCIVFIALSSD